MPLYEYACSACAARFTKLQPMSAPREGHECPCCGKKQTRRVMSGFATATSAKGSAGSCGPGGGFT